MEGIEGIIGFLKSIKDLEEVSDSQLQWLVAHSEVRSYAKGKDVFTPGSPADELFIVLEGKFRIHLHRQGEVRELGFIEAGDVTGVLPYSRMVTTNAQATAQAPCKVLALHRDQFQALIRDNFELTQAFVHVMTNRVRSFTTLQSQNEKLMSLGKLSAGLAHELNNPASAIVRSSHALRDHLKGQPDKFKKVLDIEMTPEKVDLINELLFSKIQEHKPNNLSLMDRADLEDDLTDWLEDNDFEDAHELVENLVEFDFSLEDLEMVKKGTGVKDLIPVTHWIESNLSTERMVEEIQEASTRIATLITSIKSYSHMDKSNDRQDVDIHEGIRSTLTMLKHKIKRDQIILIENFEEGLPKIKAFPGELNQVWTNIIDNAVDALAAYGEEPNPSLSITTTSNDSFVKIYFKDNGPGIPKESLSSIFDPFYTTKELGKGTGLGLDVVMKIVRQHRGEVKVISEVGMTEFEVCLPVGH